MSDGLHVCPECRSELVQPLKWEQLPARPEWWKLWRRCPECWWETETACAPDDIDDYDEALDNGAYALRGELKDLEREAMSKLADSFTVALERDLISSDDFC